VDAGKAPIVFLKFARAPVLPASERQRDNGARIKTPDKQMMLA